MNVIPFPGADADAPVLHNIPLLLRMLAERIEAGDYGDFNDPETIARCACVLRVSHLEPIVLGFGASADGPQTYMDVHAGAQELLSMHHMSR